MDADSKRHVARCRAVAALYPATPAYREPPPIHMLPQRTGPPPRDNDPYYTDCYSVPVWIQAKKGYGAAVRWSFNYNGWVDHQWRDGTRPDDCEWLSKVSKNAPWILLPFHDAGARRKKSSS